jgi:hypothetical protein
MELSISRSCDRLRQDAAALDRQADRLRDRAAALESRRQDSQDAAQRRRLRASSVHPEGPTSPSPMISAPPP